MPDSVTCSVTESDTGFPHILLSQSVQLVSTRTFRETCTLQGYMSLEHISIIEFSLLRNASSEPNGTRDIRRSIQILTTTIQQQHPFRLDLCAVLFRSGIMDYRSVAFVTGYRAETLLHEVLTLSAELMQFLHQVPLGLRLSIGKRFLFEPLEEPSQSSSILTHSNPLAFQLHGVLLRLVNENRRFGVDLLASLGNSFKERLIDLGSIVQQRSVQRADIFKHRLVRLHVNTVKIKVVLRC